MDDLTEHLESLSDDDLLDATRQAYIHLQAAADDAPESEWHQSCFAGLILYAEECRRRGLSTPYKH